MPFLPGPENPKWRSGKTVTKDGYIRITSGPDRNKYEHRAKAEEQHRLKYGTGLSETQEVHHQNFIRHCNHDWNLIIMDEAIHHALPRRTRSRRKKKNGS